MEYPLDMIAEDLSHLSIAILELLESNDEKPVKGKTTFQKEMFLIGNFISEIGEEADFFPHSFGPYSEASEIGLNDLISLGLVEEKSKSTYVITKSGHDVLDIVPGTFSSEERRSIANFKNFFGDLTNDELLLFVYVSYPDYVNESIVYSEVMIDRAKNSLSMYKKGAISLEKAAFLAGLNIENYLDLLRGTKV